ncbi:ABC transporter substrate-binding protein, partial [Blautia pseudococcoides]|nr:ABC transporter substrate-binding protein [Blautia pseudococcoides]
AFFKTNPFDVLNEVKDEIAAITVNENTFTLGDYMCTTTLNNVLQDGMDVKEAIQDAQDYVDLEQDIN